MGDNLDDSFEVDGEAIDYAGGPDDEDMVTDEESEEGKVVDSVGPSHDVGEFRQMEPDVGVDSADGEGDVEEESLAGKRGRNGESADKPRVAEVAPQSPEPNAMQSEKKSGDNDDEPYLEIMVSEQEFDDVGEMGRDAVSRDFARTEASTDKSKSTSSSSRGGRGRSSSSKHKEKSRKKESPKTTSAAPSTSQRRSERSRDSRTEPISPEKQPSPGEKSPGGEGGKGSSRSSKSSPAEKEKAKAAEKKDSGSSSKAKSSPSAKSKVVKEEKDQPTSPVSVSQEEVGEEKVKKELEQSAAGVDAGKAESSEATQNAGKEAPVKSESSVSGGDQSGLVVSIRNLAEKTTANDLKEKLAEIAPVLTCTIFLRKQNERYALVKFRTIDDCNACVVKFNNVEVDGNVLTVALAPKRKLPTSAGKSETDGGGEKTNGRRIVRTTRSGSGNTKKSDETAQKEEGKNGKKSPDGRSRPLRLRSPIRPPPHSPTHKTRTVTDASSRLHRPGRPVSPARLRSQRDVEQMERQRVEFEKRRVFEWKRNQQERMRREEDLMKRKAEVEALRLDRERARLKLERERLESERIALERQKHRDRELLERERKRREEEERRMRSEREREREREKERDRLRPKRGRDDRDSDRDRAAKRRSAEPSSRSRVDDRDRDSRREGTRTGDRGYGDSRTRAASPRSRRAASPTRRPSPVRTKLREPERYVSTHGTTRIGAFDHNQRPHDNDRGGAVTNSGDASRRFPDFRADRGGAVDFGSRRQDGGRGDHWTGNGFPHGNGQASSIGATSWNAPVVPSNQSGGHAYPAPNTFGPGMGGGQNGQYIERQYQNNPTPAIRQRY